MEEDYIKSQFVTNKIALKLKELGFSIPFFSAYTESGNLMDIGNYSNDDKIGELDGHSYYISCLAPLWQQVIDWFREKYKLNIDITFTYPNSYNIGIFNMNKRCYSICDIYYDSYQEAREQAILKCIELCQKEDLRF